MNPEENRTYTIVIVDDSKEDRYLLKRFLKKTGLPLEILEAVNGLEAINLLTQSLDKLKAEHPAISQQAVLFLDINMPIMNGWEFVAELDARQSEVALESTVVVMYSTSDASYEKEKAKNFPTVVSYIVKGETSPEQLKQLIVAYRTDIGE